MNPNNRMGRFMIDDREPLFMEFVKDAGGQRSERIVGDHAMKQISSLGFDGIDSVDPAVQHDVRPQNVDLDPGMLYPLADDLFPRLPGLPELQPFGRDVNRQRLGEDSEPTRSDVAGGSSSSRANSSKGVLKSALMAVFSAIVSSGTS